ILDLSKIESDSFKLKTSKNSIKDIVKKAIDSLKSDLKNKKIIIEDESEDHYIDVEENLIIQAVINLMHNAIKYSNDSSKIIIRTKMADKNISVEVEDFGTGIPEKDLPRIFERFYRVDKARSKEVGGTGLGLAIVKHIIQSHGGDVFVKSVEGQGSTFIFTLPIK
ncbi:MAG: ATP-binding protein, partial [bacterium]